MPRISYGTYFGGQGEAIEVVSGGGCGHGGVASEGGLPGGGGAEAVWPGARLRRIQDVERAAGGRPRAPPAREDTGRGGDGDAHCRQRRAPAAQRQGD
eukprot:4146995-Pyramimonas_sp.AAC.4